jgi:hypothetical protein
MNASSRVLNFGNEGGGNGAQAPVNAVIGIVPALLPVPPYRLAVRIHKNANSNLEILMETPAAPATSFLPYRVAIFSKINLKRKFCLFSLSIGF